MTVQEIQQEIIEEFSMFEDWNEKYEYIINLGQELEPMAPEYHAEKYIINGCQSQVWLHSYEKDGKIYFEADSDALIVKGLIALLIRVYSGQTPQDIIENPPDFLHKIGMEQHLSPMRSNGLNEMIKKINHYARQTLK